MIKTFCFIFPQCIFNLQFFSNFNFCIFISEFTIKVMKNIIVNAVKEAQGVICEVFNKHLLCIDFPRMHEIVGFLHVKSALI